MKNKFNETGSDFGRIHHIEPKSNDEFSEYKSLANEPDCCMGKIKWTNPVASRRLVKQLIGLVNSEAEYNMLLKDLAEGDIIIVSQSSALKRGSA